MFGTNGTGYLTMMRRKFLARFTGVMIVVSILIMNPFAQNAPAQTRPVWISDAAVEIPAVKPRRVVNVREYVRERASRHGWSWEQWRAVVALVNVENTQWRIDAKNGEGSSAYGLFQILRMPHGTPLREQVDRFIRYIEHRYDGDPVKAWAHHREMGWY